MSGPNNGHGHVRPRADGVRARCGGPGICGQCSVEAAQAYQPHARFTAAPEEGRPGTDAAGWPLRDGPEGA